MSVLVSVVAATLLLAPQHEAMPKGMSHEEHLKQMEKDEALKKRGADAITAAVSGVVASQFDISECIPHAR